jgi:hypothetical protein
MNCWHCNTQLIWGADHDIEEEDTGYIMETNGPFAQTDDYAGYVINNLKYLIRKFNEKKT